VLEIAIVCSYSVKEPQVVERFLKREQHSFERSFGTRSIEHWGIPDTTKQLPDYREMGKTAVPELIKAWNRLSHLSHPKQASPYSMVEFGPLTAEEFFMLRAMPVVDDIDIAIEQVISAWKTINDE
jgi:hypothetical protein